MTIEATLYSRLSSDTTLTNLVGGRLYPTTPAEDTALPFAVYGITSTMPQLATTGPMALSQYGLTVDAYAVNLADVLAVVDAVRSRLHGYAGAGVQGCWLTDQQTQQEEYGYHCQQSYTVWS